MESLTTLPQSPSPSPPFQKLCVLGIGYIGLPTAAMFATHGFEVVGVDSSPRVVDILNNGGLHIAETGLKTLVQAALKSGNLRVVGEPEPADVFIIAVPTPLGAEGNGPGLKRADLTYIITAGEAVVPHLRPGNLVVLESTVPPGTTVNVLIPILERSGLAVAGASNGDGLAAGVHVAYCPERVLPGRILEELVGNARVIGGVDLAAAEIAKRLYTSFVQGDLLLTDVTTAEMVKLMENTYRDVNIALANELAVVAEQVGIDVWKAIELANRHPRVNLLNPGPGVGGHCIAVDPWFIVQAAPHVTPLIQTARKVNDAMPSHIVERLKRALSGIDFPVIACLGLTYKADVDDIRESPAMEVLRLLQVEDFHVRVYDPLVPIGMIAEQVGSLEAAVTGADAIVVLTDHSEFRQLRSEALKGFTAHVVIDTRNALVPCAALESPFGRTRAGPDGELAATGRC
jgi:UDP-N-acetyl-D-mannosaminuronic acid dehydrogenase